jgi:hypothetical protein
MEQAGKLTEYTKKYGSSFLLWCAVVFLYQELSDAKEDLRDIQAKLYACMEIRANTAKNELNTGIRLEAVLSNKKRHGIEKKMEG